MPTTLEALLASSNGSDIYVLDRAGLADLTREIFRNVNTRIEERIVTSLDEGSDADHVPSSNTVYSAVKNLSKIKNLTITSGNINEAMVAPDPSALYVVRKNAADTNATMYIWIEGIGYISCGGGGSVEAGDTTISAIPTNVIAEIVSTSYAETDPGISDDEEEATTPTE